MDIVKLYEDFNIPYKTEGHKHCREGWVNVPCPFCTGEHEGYHLGFPLHGKTFVCWRCGKHSLLEGLTTLLNISFKDARLVANKYGGLSVIKDKPKPQIQTLKFKYPSNTGKMEKAHRRYLKERGFDPKHLEEVWGILGTGPLSFLKDGDKLIDYKHRILIPIYWDGQIVTFQTRLIKEIQHNTVKYLACPKAREKIHHKHIVYAHPEYWEKMKGGLGIIVEGVTDVWKLGEIAICTFGIKYKKEQVRILGRHLKYAAVVFDDEPQAIEQAEKLVAELQMFGVTAWRVPIKGDPGSMTMEQAAKFVKRIKSSIL